MQVVTTLPVVQAVSDVGNYYVSIQPIRNGYRTNDIFVSPSMAWTPVTNTLNLSGNLIVTGSLSGQMNGLSILDNTMPGEKISNIGKLAERVWLVPYPAPSGNINVDISNGAIQFFTANATANMTLNLRGNVSSAFNNNLLVGQSLTTVVLLTHGATKYSANIYIDGVLQSARWLGNTRSSYTASLVNSINESISITAIKTDNAAYTVLASSITYALPSAIN